jgi:hypothetical protein
MQIKNSLSMELKEEKVLITNLKEDLRFYQEQQVIHHMELEISIILNLQTQQVL